MTTIHRPRYHQSGRKASLLFFFATVIARLAFGWNPSNSYALFSFREDGILQRRIAFLFLTALYEPQSTRIPTVG